MTRTTILDDYSHDTQKQRRAYCVPSSFLGVVVVVVVVVEVDVTIVV
jgi:hypothetical protein